MNSLKNKLKAAGLITLVGGIIYIFSAGKEYEKVGIYSGWRTTGENSSIKTDFGFFGVGNNIDLESLKNTRSLYKKYKFKIKDPLIGESKIVDIQPLKDSI